jgi:hypothetical protein
MEGREEEFKLLTEHKARGPASEPSCRRGPARLRTKDRAQVKEAAVEAKRREAESQEHLAAARDAMERQHELQAEPPPPFPTVAPTRVPTVHSLC